MKKMRKLIPALAMLLVSAVMMSTASFAWFSMNDVATATGMSVQAKASGNLLISNEKMTAAWTGISVELGSTKKNLFPITYNTSVWQYPTNGEKVDPLYGTYTDGTMTDLVATDAPGEYFSQYVVYLATAGDAFTQDLYIDLSPIAGATEKIAPAYSVAVYVGDTIDWNKPDKVYNYKHFTDTGTELLVKEDVAIPSTYGINADNKVGTKVTVRIYVDGALAAPSVTVKEPLYTTAADSETYNATAMKDWKFYAASDTKHENVLDKTMFTEGMSLKGYVYDKGETQNVTKDVTYVNNTTVPTGATVFEIDFSCKA